MVTHIKNMLKTVLLVFLLPGAVLAWDRQARCPDIQTRGVINVLTINLLYSENMERLTRFEILAAFLRRQADQGDPVDVILLQEVVGGFLSGTQNSSRDLKQMLAENGLMYNLRYCPVNDQIGILSEGIAILSRCRFLVTVVKPLATVWETPEAGFDIPLKRKGMMGRIHVPRVGNINVFNTHLCAYCDAAERQAQGAALLKFQSDVERIIFWDKSPAVLGGDFNLRLETREGMALYEQILSFGFEDSYAAIHACGDCCSRADGYEGCTYGVDGNPYADDVTGRIDFIFAKRLKALQSTVVFNDTPDWVSDHSGVLTKFAVLK